MKKTLLLSLVTSSVLMAGGDFVPVEPIVETPVVEQSMPSSFYIGLGYSNVNAEDTVYYDYDDTYLSGDHQQNAILLLAGYNVNKYIGIEARYTAGINSADSDIAESDGATSLDDSYDANIAFDNIAVYLKPMYPIGNYTLYGLVGYGKSSYTYPSVVYTDDAAYTISDDISATDFQYGIGMSYALNEKFSMFIDYTKLAEDDSQNKEIGYWDTPLDGDSLFINDTEAYTINFGVTYTF